MYLHPVSQKILADYQVRKSRKQKLDFEHWLVRSLANEGVEMWTEEHSGLFKSRNLIVGDPDNCDYILSAHYDTAPVLPFPNFIAPRNLLITILYQLVVIMVPLSLLIAGLSFLLSHFFSEIHPLTFFLSNLFLLFLVLGLMLIGPANKHTANDNTSGVISVIETILAVSSAKRERICFVLFDLEEAGLLGSAAFRKKHNSSMKTTPLINLDCVSDGDHLLVVLNRKASQLPEFKQRLMDSFQAHVQEMPDKILRFEKAERIFYPSDQMGFPLSAAIAVFKKKPLIGYYIDRLHTRHDVIFDEHNIQIISSALASFFGCGNLPENNGTDV